MRHLKKLFVLTMAAVLVAVIVPGLLAGEAKEIISKETVAKININTASVEELSDLKYIGPQLAARIVEHRTKYGAFEKLEDITKVKGIGAKVLEENQDRLAIK